MMSLKERVSAFVSAKQQWFDGAQMLVAYLAPIYLAPLLLRGTTEGRCAYCMLIVFEFWVLNVIPAPMASTVPLVLLPLLGVMDPDNVARHYMNETMLFIVGVVLLALAMEGTNMYSRVALTILGAGGAGVKVVFTALMALAFCGTLLFENVLSTLIVMPVVECTIVEIENDALTTSRRRRMLRRASVMARLKNQPDPDQPNQRLPALMASAPQLVGSMAFPQISRRSSRSSRDTLWTPDSGQSSTYGKGVLGCRRRSSAITIDFAAKFEQESQRYSYDRLTILSWIVICLPISAAGILACWVSVFVVFLKQYDCEEDDETKESIAKILEEKYRALGNFRGLQDTTFVFALVLVFFATPQQPYERLFSEYLLEWGLVQRKVPWSAFITYGGGLCVAGAIKESGLMAWLSSVLMVMRHWPPVFVQLVLMLITTVLTEVNNDTAAATVLIPIAFDLLSPVFFVKGVTILAIFVSVHTTGSYYYSFNTFPEWANKTLTGLNSTAPSL